MRERETLPPSPLVLFMVIEGICVGLRKRGQAVERQRGKNFQESFIHCRKLWGETPSESGKKMREKWVGRWDAVFNPCKHKKCHAVLSCSLMFSQTFFSKWFIHKSDSRRQKEGERKENEVQVEISCIAILPEQNCSLLNCITETQTERMRKKWCWRERTHLES